MSATKWARLLFLVEVAAGCSGIGEWGGAAGAGGARGDTGGADVAATSSSGAGGSGLATGSTSGGAGGGANPGGSGGAGGTSAGGGFGPPDGEPPLVTSTFAPSTEDFVNPERGFHGNLTLPAPNVGDYRAAGSSLIRSYVVLDRTSDTIASAFLSNLTASLGRVRDRGLKVVMRFAYGLTAGPDAPLSRVEAHIAQVKPILQANADVILALQAGFIGQWGEWHDSTSGIDNDADRRTVLNALLDALPSSRMIQLRYPWKLRPIFPDLLTDATAFSEMGGARVGLHDDCFVADDTDTGTYWDFKGDKTSAVAMNRDFAAKQTRYLPSGGESCANGATSGCATATSEAATFHFTYLNADFNSVVNARWNSEGCMPEIRRRLGYRIELERVSASREVAPGGLLYFEVVLRNVGYAAPFNARPVFVVLDGGGQTSSALLAAADFRRWSPEAGEIKVSAKVRIPVSAAPGSYRVAFWLPDAAADLQKRGEYAVRFANANVWNGGTSDNTIVPALRVDPQAIGARDPGADQFVVVP
jgi:Domain of unknown function (DUF4832)/Domain of unknown function (DUF4874)